MTNNDFTLPMTNIEYNQDWFPYDVRTFEVQTVPLTLPPGKVFECDVRIALGNWAWANKISHVGVVSADMAESFEIKIKPSPDNPSDWVYDS